MIKTQFTCSSFKPDFLFKSGVDATSSEWTLVFQFLMFVAYCFFILDEVYLNEKMSEKVTWQVYDSQLQVHFLVVPYLETRPSELIMFLNSEFVS